MTADTLTPHELGALGEDMAARWLQEHQFTILDRNTRTPGVRGELDIIALDNTSAELVFVEVKTRRTTIAGWPEEAITPLKERTIRRIAAAWLASSYRISRDILPPHRGIRFDVISLLGNPTEGFAIHHFPRVLA